MLDIQQSTAFLSVRHEREKTIKGVLFLEWYETRKDTLRGAQENHIALKRIVNVQKIEETHLREVIDHVYITG